MPPLPVGRGSYASSSTSRRISPTSNRDVGFASRNKVSQRLTWTISLTISSGDASSALCEATTPRVEPGRDSVISPLLSVRRRSALPSVASTPACCVQTFDDRGAAGQAPTHLHAGERPWPRTHDGVTGRGLVQLLSGGPGDLEIARSAVHRRRYRAGHRRSSGQICRRERMQGELDTRLARPSRGCRGRVRRRAAIVTQESSR